VAKTMETKRSDGVLVLGIIAIVYGIWSLFHDFASLWVTLTDPQLYSHMFQTRGPKAARLIYFESIYFLISYSVFIISGVAVLKMKNWGRILLIAISSISFVLSLILPYIWTRIMSDEYHKAFLLPTPIPILYVMNIWFFNKKRIRKQFV
jgi:uncharacterized membrane protein HdeD (DUF308 family)